MNTSVQHNSKICAAFCLRDSILSLHNLVFICWVLSRDPLVFLGQSHICRF
jgi:hypothetical protein